MYIVLALLKALLPHEYNDYHIDHGTRINSYLSETGEQLSVHRANNEHRAIRISRGVLSNKIDQKPSTFNITASNVIFLGST